MARWRLTIIEEGTADTREEAILMFDGDSDVELPIDYETIEYKIEEIADPWDTSKPDLRYPDHTESCAVNAPQNPGVGLWACNCVRSAKVVKTGSGS